MPSRFADAVGQVVKALYDGPTRPEHRAEVDYVTDAARLGEADAVAPLVEGLAAAELFSTHDGKGIGIYGLNMIPAVGHQLGRRMKKTDAAQQERALHAIRESVAAGYVGFLSLEPIGKIAYKPSSDLARNWRIMTASFRGPISDRLGLPDDVKGVVENVGEHSLVYGLREAGVLGKRVARIGLVGRYYAYAGAYLRAGQTDFEALAGLETASNMLPDLWPHARYVQS
jgi:hypothetical protein